VNEARINGRYGMTTTEIAILISGVSALMR
jgi:hypothetical protein